MKKTTATSCGLFVGPSDRMSMVLRHTPAYRHLYSQNHVALKGNEVRSANEDKEKQTIAKAMVCFS